MKPATPGFLVTLTATILLALVSFSVPWFKSIYFLKASLSVAGIDGSITFGTLGYCVHLSNGTTCSKPSVGYELDIDQLVGNRTRIQIPEVIVKWITYALVLHIVALVFAAISSVFGLLAHVREFSMSCFSSCVSGAGAAIALLAFIFDLVFFFLARSRLNSVRGGRATLGNAIWLTLVAWLLLFFSGCFYSLGRCCIRRRPRDMKPKDGGGWAPTPSTGPTYEEQMRLDAVKAEADRKARQNQGELGLPSFPEYDPRQPLTSDAEHETMPHAPYRDTRYAAAAVGTRAVDDYHPAGNNAYPPRRQPTTSSAYTQQTGYARSHQASGYTPSVYSDPTSLSTVPLVSTGYVNADNIGRGQGPSQYGNNTDYAQYTYPDYNTTPARGGLDNSGEDPFQAYTTPQGQSALNPSTYNAASRFSPPLRQPSTQPQPYSSPVAELTSSYYTPQVVGGGYGDSIVPVPHDPRTSTNTNNSGYLPYPGESTSSAYAGVEVPTSPQGPREPGAGRLPSPSQYDEDESPPMYEDPAGIGASHRAVVSRKQ